MTRIALDAMGGDHAPGEIVVGAVEAAAGIPGVKVLLVGQLAPIQAELDKLPKDLKKSAQTAIEHGLLEIVHAPDVAEMDESPVDAVRKKKDCSINVAMRLVKEGRADAFVSAGNSGAVATSAILTLGRIPGVKRPAIATVMPNRTPRRPLVVLDAGANMDCHPEWLVQFAIMGNAYSKAVLKRTTPAIGLISIGTEDCKGNEMTKQTFPLLKEVKDLNFVGNIEGKDLYKGQIDVAVCDGFVGNVVLKTTESIAKAIGYWLKRECFRGPWRVLGALLLKGAFRALKKQLDPEIYGGAPLLGVPGAVIIGHGSSSHKAIYYAVKAGVAAATNDVSGLIHEKKWQKYWLENKTFRTTDGTDGRSGAPAPQPKDVRPKFYCLDMFPYPSGAGLHVGHPEGYTATDILCRYKRMKGFNVLHPMGWDAFGLPAEQYAVETGTHPAITTKKNVDRFREQIRALGFSYDWDREVNTTDPKYYRWTQWIFEQLYKKGLAYVAEVPVNWCPALGTVLANEEVIDGRSERGNHPVTRRPMRQWMLKITEYAERLLKDLDTLDWPEGIKEMQRNWIGKSTGALVDFGVEGVEGDVITVYTTRCDTLFGATYMVLSPEHALVAKWLEDGTLKNADEVKAYQKKAASKSDLERTELNKEKTGVRLDGVVGVNPVNGDKLPIFISDYVLASYGTGAIMAVPAHDERDFDFAKVFNLPIYQVVAPAGKANSEKSDGSANAAPSVDAGALAKASDNSELISRVPYTGSEAFTDIATGVMVNSGFLNGLSVEAARPAMIKWLGGKGRRQGEDAVQAPRLALLAPALLGRAVPGDPLGGRHEHARSRGRPAAHAPRACGLQADGHGRASAREGDGLGQCRRSQDRQEGRSRDEHDAAVGGKLLVLPPLHRSYERQVLCRSRASQEVASRRPLRRRRGACGSAPPLRALLAQGPLRPRVCSHAGAFPASRQPGDDPGYGVQDEARSACADGQDRMARRQAMGRGRGRRDGGAHGVPREDVEVAQERGQSRRRDSRLRR